MKTITRLFFFLLLYSNSNAQTAATHTVFFDTDKHVISPAEQKKLDAFISKIGDGVIESIELSGHTDSDASSEYNLDLSKRRVETVKEQLSGLNVTTKKVSAKFYGEDQPADVNTSISGKQNNRRVDIVLSVKKEPEIEPRPDVEKSVIQDCSYDTTLIFPQGTHITMNVCDYLKNEDCFSLSEYNEGSAIRASNLTTMTSNNQPLISGGMFDINLCSGVCAKVRIPVRETCGEILNYSVWGVTPDGRWDEIKTSELKIVELGGRKYYETEVCKSGKINFDVKPIKPPKVKIKAKGVDLVNAKISFDKPAGVYLPYKVTKHKAVFRLSCPCSEPLISAVALNNSGDTLRMPFVNANLSLEKREAFGKCKTNDVAKKILFFKIREKAMYRKYIIRKKDFKH